MTDIQIIAATVMIVGTIGFVAVNYLMISDLNNKLEDMKKQRDYWKDKYFNK